MKRPHALLLTLLLALWALAWGMRLRGLPAATVGSYSLGQFLAALGLLRGGGLPHPPNPEGGHSLWLMVLPLLPLADSLQGLLQLRFALGALVAPLCGLAAWLLAEDRGRFPAALAAGVVVALDPGLIDTLIVAFRGYGAPELLALATVGGALALRGQRGGLALAGLSLLAATGQHPFAAGAGLGALLCLPLIGPGLSTVQHRDPPQPSLHFARGQPVQARGDEIAQIGTTDHQGIVVNHERPKGRHQIDDSGDLTLAQSRCQGDDLSIDLAVHILSELKTRAVSPAARKRGASEFPLLSLLFDAACIDLASGIGFTDAVIPPPHDA